MRSFLNRHLWIVIVLIGLIVLFIQGAERAHLRAQLSGPSESRSSRPTRTRTLAVQIALPSSQELLKEYEEKMEINDTSSLLALSKILSSASSADLVQILDDLPGDPSFQDLRNQLELLLRLFDPLTALEREATSSKKFGIFMDLARQSPEVASEWVFKTGASDSANWFVMEINEGLLLADPSSYTGSWADLDLDPPFLLPETFDSVAAAINNPEQVKNRGIMIQSLLISACIEDPALARSYAAELNLTNDELTSALNLFSGYEMGSPDLLEWTLTLPDSIDSPQENFMATYARRDPKGAAKWLTELEAPSKTKDLLIGRYALVLQHLDPVQALPWLDRIEDPGRQQETRKRILGNWRFEDPKAAAIWEANQ